MDVNRIGAYLRREGVEGVNVFPRAKHGEGMMGRGKGFRQVLDWYVHCFLKTTDPF